MKTTLEAVSEVTDIAEVQLIRNALEQYLQPIYTKAVADRKQEHQFTGYVAESKPKYSP